MRWMALGIAAALLTGAAGAAGGPVTYTEHVAPIVFESCASCHRPGEIAPFSLMDYKTARAWAKAIKKSVHDRSMPPWHADSEKTEFANDRSLTQDEIDTIIAWVDQGAKQGDPSKMPEPPEFDDTWVMGEPDFIFHGTRDFEVPALVQEIKYQSIYFDPPLEEDMYITAWEIRHTAREAVHHANLVRAPQKLDPVGIGQAVQVGGDYIGSYLPGARPFEYPEGAALILPKGNTIQIQVHYVGLDEPVTDHVMFGVKYAQGRVDKILRTIGTDNNDIEIEPHDPNFEKRAEVNLLYPMRILSSGAHMHLRGSGYTASAVLPDGEVKLIADVPRYDFNWQVNYELANPIDVPKGTVYRIDATWDNSENNPLNPDPSQKVVYGPWTENEMLTTWSHVVLTEENLGLKVKDGRVVGEFDDRDAKPHPFALQSFPQTFGD
jgi:mono/diheme cytochrome c family protein